MFTEVHCIVSGKVQNVFYRAFVQDVAKKHEITGWARNNPKGTVEVLGQGLPDDLKLFVEKLHEGSVSSSVDSVSVDWKTPKKQFEDFVVIYN